MPDYRDRVKIFQGPTQYQIADDRHREGAKKRAIKATGLRLQS
jgi:hypothetical protein